MTLQGRTIRGLIAGALGGLIAWLLIDKTGWFNALLYNPEGLVHGTRSYWLQAVLGGVYGLIIAVAVTIGDWTIARSGAQRLRSLVLSGIAGLLGGALGIQIGQWAYDHLLSTQSPSSPGATSGQMLNGLIARSVGWALIGLAIGAAQGIPRSSWRVAKLGAIGGFMGGLAGGAVFEALEDVTSSPAAARLVGFLFVGAATGFFLEVVPILLKQAWLRVESGRVAGGEFLLEKASTTIGRSELADIRLNDDPSIAPIHCTIEVGSSFSRLRPGRPDARSSVTPAPLKVNGKLVTTDMPLLGGESIVIGKSVLRFNVRLGQQPARPARRPSERQQPAKSIPVVANATRSTYTASRPVTTEKMDSAPVPEPLDEKSLAGTKLICTEGAYSGQVFPLSSRPSVIIGRISECDIPLAADKTISRRHAVIRSNSERHLLEDLKSANGTWINGGRLIPNRPMMLKAGDRIKLGDTVLTYE